MRACAGALFGILTAGLLSYLVLPASYHSAWLIAPMGASAVLLFAVPASPLAQPWSVIGGNLVAATIGVACAQMVDAPMLAAALAIALAIGAMFALRCIHPPSGAVALTAVLGGPAIHAMGFSFVLAPVAVNSFCYCAPPCFSTMPPAAVIRMRSRPSIAIRITRKTVCRLSVWDLPTKIWISSCSAITRCSISAAMIWKKFSCRQKCWRIAAGLANRVRRHHVGRYRGGRLPQLEDAWQLMLRHKLKAMPVLDRARRVIGIITRTDFLHHAAPPAYSGLRAALQALLRRAHHSHSAKPEVVGQIMSVDVKTVARDLPIVQLVGLMTDGGVHQVPVIDDDRRLVGMVSRSDMIAALYKQSGAGAQSGKRQSRPAEPFAGAVSKIKRARERTCRSPACGR